MVAIEIADEAVRPDSDVATRLRCVEQLRPGIEKLLEGSAVRQVMLMVILGARGPFGLTLGLV